MTSAPELTSVLDSLTHDPHDNHARTQTEPIDSFPSQIRRRGDTRLDTKCDRLWPNRDNPEASHAGARILHTSPNVDRSLEPMLRIELFHGRIFPGNAALAPLHSLFQPTPTPMPTPSSIGIFQKYGMRPSALNRTRYNPTGKTCRPHHISMPTGQGNHEHRPHFQARHNITHNAFSRSSKRVRQRTPVVMGRQLLHYKTLPRNDTEVWTSSLISSASKLPINVTQQKTPLYANSLVHKLHELGLRYVEYRELGLVTVDKLEECVRQTSFGVFLSRHVPEHHLPRCAGVLLAGHRSQEFGLESNVEWLAGLLLKHALELLGGSRRHTENARNGCFCER